MKKVRVTKEFVFEMAHALYNYTGPCKNIHGHTYKLQVTVLGSVNTDMYGDKAGMVVDFSEIKQLVEDKVISHYDHALVLNEQIPASLRASAYAITEKIIFTPFQPTCENLVFYFKDQLENALNIMGLTLFAVKLYETPRSWAEWCLQDN